MAPGVELRVRGWPEAVQRIADVLDRAFPDCFDWQALPAHESDQEIRLIGSMPASARPKKSTPRRRTYKAHHRLMSVPASPVNNAVSGAGEAAIL